MVPTPEIVVQEPEPVPERQAAPPLPIKSEHEVMSSVFRTAGMILSARALMALCLMGAFVLAITSILKGGILPLVALGLYSASTILPLVWLDIRTRRSM